MQDIILHLTKSAGLISLFFLGYYFLLKNDTSFKSNRFFLLAGIFTSLLLPFLEITRTVEVQTSTAPLLLENFPAEMSPSASVQSPSIDWWLIAGSIYFAGLSFFLLKFILELFSLLRVIFSHKTEKKENFKIINKEGVTQPFSFFSYIVLDRSQHSALEQQMILKHEMSHARQWHSIDQIISSLCVYLLWFNPLSWLYRKSLVQNLEFLADKEVVAAKVSKKEYQRALLKISVRGFEPALSNQFYQSLIKNRIIMINKDEPQKSHFWKASLLLPFIFAFIFTFNIKTEAQEVPLEQTSPELVKDKAITGTHDPENIFKSLGKSPLYLIGGKEYKTSELYEKYIQIMGDWNVLIPEDAIIKYGRKAKDGAIIITEGKILDDIKDALKNMDLQEMNFNKPFIQVKRNAFPVLALADFNVRTTSTNRNNFSVSEKIKFKQEPEDIIAVEDKNEKSQVYFSHKNKPLVLINGKIQQEDLNASDLDPSKIKSLMVLKEKDATAKYGEKGKNGVIEIELRSREELKRTIQEAGDRTEKDASNITFLVSTVTSSDYSERKTLTVRDVGSAHPDASKPLYIVDGKEMPEDFDPNSISSENIESFTVLRGEKATVKYGEKASNGVIEIITKE